MGTDCKKKVLVFFGMIASGKSHLAMAWTQLQQCLYLNTDVIRKQLVGIAPNTRVHCAAEEGIYNPNFTLQTYAEIRGKVLCALAGNDYCCVAIDGSYKTFLERQKLIDVIYGISEYFFIYCHCREEIVKKRLFQRSKDPLAVSDGSWELFLQQKEAFEAPDELPQRRLLYLNTEATTDDLISTVEHFIHQKC